MAKKPKRDISGEKNPMYGKHHTEATRQKMRDAHKKRKGEKHPMFGKHHTKEARENMRKAHVDSKIDEWIEREQGKHFCTCGCREEIKIERWHYRKGIPKYINHHYNPMTDPIAVEKVAMAQRGRQRSEEEIRKNSESHKGLQVGKNNPFYGKRHTEETKQKIRETKKKQYEDEEYKEKCVRATIKSWRKRPTIPEQQLIDIISKHNLPYRYTGDGDVIIGGKNPDFFNTNGNKVVIEVFGKAFHSPLFTFKKHIPHNSTYEGTLEHYKKYGLKCIIFWDSDVIREDAEQFVISVLKKENAI